MNVFVCPSRGEKRASESSRDAAVRWMVARPALLLDDRPPLVCSGTGAVHYIISASEAASSDS